MKRKIITLFSGILTAVCLISCTGVVSAADIKGNIKDQHIETAEYTAKSEDTPYSFESEIQRDGNTYRLQSISYQTLSKLPILKKETITTTKEISNLYEKEIETEPTLFFNDSNGQELLGTLSDTQYQDSVITDRTTELTASVTSGYVIAQPTLPPSRTVEYFDTYSHQTITANLPIRSTQMTTAYSWISDVNIPMQVRVYDAGYYLLNHRYVTYNDEKPALTGYEQDILTVLCLPESSYRITDFQWDGDTYEQNGILYRNAVARGERYVGEYTAYYSDTVRLPDANGYTAILTYSAETEQLSDQMEYTIEATAIYEKETSAAAIITITVVSILIGIAAIILILYLIAKKRKNRTV